MNYRYESAAVHPLPPVNISNRTHITRASTRARPPTAAMDIGDEPVAPSVIKPPPKKRKANNNPTDASDGPSKPPKTANKGKEKATVPDTDSSPPSSPIQTIAPAIKDRMPGLFSTMATLESVVGGDYVAAWKEEQVKHPLVQFHAKYWGVSTKEEVTELQESAQDEVMDIDIEHDDNNKVGGDSGAEGGEQEGENEDENKGKGKEKEEAEEEDEREGEDEVETDDYIEGCRVLDINIKGIESSIWVRAEYIRIFDHIVELHRDLTSSKRIDERSYCVIITGHPGIGKSKFFEYVKWRCCAEKRPFVWYDEGYRYLVAQEGVFRAPSDFLSRQFQGFVWTLVDADQDRGGVPESLVTRHTGHFVIYASSPARSRWARVHKTIREHLIVMDPWTRKEIHRAAPLRLNDPDFIHINNIFDELGPIPRLCLDYNEIELAQYRDSLSKELSKLTITKLDDLAAAARTLEMDASGAKNLGMYAISHKICLVRRLDPADLDKSFEIEVLPVTAIIGSRIAFQLRDAERSEQIRLYNRLSALPEGKKLSGNLFKAYCQQRFRERISIKFVPMVRLQDSEASKNKHQWHTSNTKLEPPLLEKARKAALKKITSVNIRPSGSFVFIPPKDTTPPSRSGVFRIPATECVLDITEDINFMSETTS